MDFSISGLLGSGARQNHAAQGQGGWAIQEWELIWHKSSCSSRYAVSRDLAYKPIHVLDLARYAPKLYMYVIVSLKIILISTNYFEVHAGAQRPTTSVVCHLIWLAGPCWHMVLNDPLFKAKQVHLPMASCFCDYAGNVGPMSQWSSSSQSV